MHVALKLFMVVHDFHRAPTENIRRSDNKRVTNFIGGGIAFFDATYGAIRRLLKAELLDQLLEPLAVLSSVDRVRRRTYNRDACSLETLN